MSRARVAVLKVLSKQLTVTAAAAEYGYSRRQLTRVLARYRTGGLDAVEPRSRRPRSNSVATPPSVREGATQPATTGSATTVSPPTAKSAFAAPAACTTSASA